MSTITHGDAVIRLKLDTRPAEADLQRFRQGAERTAVEINARMRGGSGGGGGGVPGAPGGGFLPGVLGAVGRMGPAGLALAAVGGAAAMFAGPLVKDAFGGLSSRLGGAGRDFSEAIGLGAWSRNGSVPQRAADATVSGLGMAGKFMSDDAIRGFYGVQRGMAQMDTDAENRVRGLIGSDRVDSFQQELLDTLKRIAGNTERPPAAPTGSGVIPGVK